MKKIIVMLAIVSSTLSVSAHALDIIAVMSTSGGLLTSSEKRCQNGGCNKEAMRILEDSQDYAQSGKMSASLDQEVRNLKAVNGDMSDAEAVDILVEAANNLLM